MEQKVKTASEDMTQVRDFTVIYIYRKQKRRQNTSLTNTIRNGNGTDKLEFQQTLPKLQEPNKPLSKRMLKRMSRSTRSNALEASRKQPKTGVPL